MPIELDPLPAPMAPPKTPRVWIWLALLLTMMAAGMALALLLGGEHFAGRPEHLWLLGLGGPTVVWCLLVIPVGIWLVGEHATVRGWNQAQASALAQATQRGQRSLQVLASSVHTALRPREASDGSAQWQALSAGVRALAVQQDWYQNNEGLRHSRLPYSPPEAPTEPNAATAVTAAPVDDSEAARALKAKADREAHHQAAKALLADTLQQALNDIVPALKSLPARQPVALLLDLKLDGVDAAPLWQAAWDASGLAQQWTLIDDMDLAVIDHWLDHCSEEETLLLVITAQVAPDPVADSGEAVAALLFGNPQHNPGLVPLANLHRPHPARHPDADAVRQAAVQALGWAQKPVTAIAHSWLAADTETRNGMAAALKDLGLPAAQKEGAIDLSAALGNLGASTPWVGIAAAVDAITTQPSTHLILTVSGAQTALPWATVVTPVAEVPA